MVIIVFWGVVDVEEVGILFVGLEEVEILTSRIVVFFGVFFFG